ncbi:hypothetical protein B5E92_10000 [Erysipelatoclostridium sp. An15]|uniref:RES domain-containing protein n=1 Tax=Erysipelatoclostridium sp. An15 TaxID=1965566 RepID=UPI000B39608D|nr:RES domain-containing protein [Erysipelatoclostridium sp. An15]OUQ07022.1 hypothetical protein B5E92_10000 [Erysipelatoclostridium sp. An15]
MCNKDYEKWYNVFYTDNGRKENYKFPKIINKDNEYYSSVIGLMDSLLTDMKEEDINGEFIEIAKKYKSIFKNILDEYYSGNIIKAYDLVEKLVNEYKESDILVSNISKSYSFNYYVIGNKKWDEFVFYRARLGREEHNYTKDDLKHTPFNMISKIGTYRFSIPGQPCLYLGTTTYDCWLEMKKPQNNEFNAGCILLKKDYIILNLSIDVGFFTEMSKSIKQNILKDLFKLLLVSMVTSYCISEEPRYFKSEYIISQLFTLACKSNEIDGIAYISKRVSSNAFGHDICMNLALFIPYEHGKEYSAITENEMIIGIPVNFAFFDKLYSSITGSIIDRLPFERSPYIKNIGNFEYQVPYKKTKFYDFDKYLYKLTKNNR